MISPKKHIVAIFLISIVCLPALLFLHLQIHQKIVQHEMMEKLERTKLETITLHNDAVRWFKKNKEIVVNSTLFDVHRYRVLKDSTVFTGLFDFKETELKSQVKKLLQRTEHNSTSRELFIAKLLLQLWTIDTNDRYLPMVKEILLSNKYIVPSGDLLSTYVSIPFPPPRVL